MKDSSKFLKFNIPGLVKGCEKYPIEFVYTPYFLAFKRRKAFKTDFILNLINFEIYNFDIRLKAKEIIEKKN